MSKKKTPIISEEEIKGKRAKEIIVIILFIIGFIFIGVSTINFIYRIPNLEMEISSSEEALRTSDDNYLLFTLYQINENSIKNQIKMLSDLNPNTTKIQSLQDELVLNRRISLDYMYASVTENIDINFRNRWYNMDFSQLENEKNNLSKISPRLDEKMTNLLTKVRHDKTELVYLSSIFQVVGLSLSQLALILQFKWFH